MKVAGIQRNSFVDWPGKISFVVFLGGCNFTCPHCHNNHILCSTSNTISIKDVLEEIKQQIGFIDGVVISGGEPTVHPNLHDIILQIRKLELPVKLDTNGSNFEMLQSLVDGKLVDFVAMDIKAPLDRYVELGFVKSKDITKQVEKSIEFLKSNKVPFMFRTTPIPELMTEDLDAIQKIVQGHAWRKNDFTPQI